jgi:hypothetical protein
MLNDKAVIMYSRVDATRLSLHPARRRLCHPVIAPPSKETLMPPGYHSTQQGDASLGRFIIASRIVSAPNPHPTRPRARKRYSCVLLASTRLVLERFFGKSGLDRRFTLLCPSVHQNISVSNPLIGRPRNLGPVGYVKSCGVNLILVPVSGCFTPRERAPGTHWIEGCVGPRTGLDAVVKGNIPSRA